jgi:hypothetical protein
MAQIEEKRQVTAADATLLKSRAGIRHLMICRIQRHAKGRIEERAGPGQLILRKECTSHEGSF